MLTSALGGRATVRFLLPHRHITTAAHWGSQGVRLDARDYSSAPADGGQPTLTRRVEWSLKEGASSCTYFHKVLPLKIDEKVAFSAKKSPTSVLSEEQIAEIKRLRQEDPFKWTQRALAQAFNVSQPMISYVAPLDAGTRAEKQVLQELSGQLDDAEAGRRRRQGRTKSGEHYSQRQRRNRIKFREMLKQYDKGVKGHIREHNRDPILKALPQYRPRIYKKF